MPLDLTDVSSWATIAVPAGTDPAITTNMQAAYQLLANRCRFLLDRAAAYYLNLNEADTTGVATLDFANVMAGCIVISQTGKRRLTIIDNDGETAISLHPGEASPSAGGGGVLWDDEADTPNASLTWTAAATLADICGAWTNNQERCAVSNSATGQVAFSSASGTWAGVAGGVAGTIWTACEAGDDGSELWVIGGNAGAMATTPDLSSTAFTSRTSGLTGAVVRIRSNRKPSSSHRFLALDDAGNVSISSADGTTWTATLVASLGLTSTLKSIAWDASADRWMGIQYNGYRAWSTDGITWTESSIASLQTFVPSASNEFFLDADDQGHVILGIHNPGTRSVIYVSRNGGNPTIPWEEAYWPAQYTYAKILFMGHGRVITAGSSGVLYSDAGFTTRWEAS